MPKDPATTDLIGPGTTVKVYYNLNKGGYSVVSRTTGRVVGWVQDITLTDVTFRVQPAGVRRIRERHQREVVAYVIGTIKDVESGPDVSGMRQVTFNPYRASTFTIDGEPVHTAPVVTFTGSYGWV